MYVSLFFHFGLANLFPGYIILYCSYWLGLLLFYTCEAKGGRIKVLAENKSTPGDQVTALL